MSIVVKGNTIENAKQASHGIQIRNPEANCNWMYTGSTTAMPKTATFSVSNLGVTT